MDSRPRRPRRRTLNEGNVFCEDDFGKDPPADSPAGGVDTQVCTRYVC